MKTLAIVWKRLVSDDGRTCERCDATYKETCRAVDKLGEALRPLGIEPKLEVRTIDRELFVSNPSESNRIWIAGRPMEEWLGAEIGSSRCCSVCGESDCRTVEVGGTAFEVIPAEILTKAALIAAATLIDAVVVHTEGVAPGDESMRRPGDR